jgi:hypothetical protein
MSYRYAESPVWVLDLHEGVAFARILSGAEISRTETSRLHHELGRALCRLARADVNVAGALVLDLGDADVAGNARLRAAFAMALQSWELSHRPVAVVQAGASVHLHRIAATVAARQCRVVASEPDAMAWINLSSALGTLPSVGYAL